MRLGLTVRAALPRALDHEDGLVQLHRRRVGADLQRGPAKALPQVQDEQRGVVLRSPRDLDAGAGGLLTIPAAREVPPIVVPSPQPLRGREEHGLLVADKHPVPVDPRRLAEDDRPLGRGLHGARLLADGRLLIGLRAGRGQAGHRDGTKLH